MTTADHLSKIGYAKSHFTMPENASISHIVDLTIHQVPWKGRKITHAVTQAFEAQDDLVRECIEPSIDTAAIPPLLPWLSPSTTSTTNLILSPLLASLRQHQPSSSLLPSPSQLFPPIFFHRHKSTPTLLPKLQRYQVYCCASTISISQRNSPPRRPPRQHVTNPCTDHHRQSDRRGQKTMVSFSKDYHCYEIFVTLYNMDIAHINSYTLVSRHLHSHSHSDRYIYVHITADTQPTTIPFEGLVRQLCI